MNRNIFTKAVAVILSSIMVLSFTSCSKEKPVEPDGKTYRAVSADIVDPGQYANVRNVVRINDSYYAYVNSFSINSSYITEKNVLYKISDEGTVESSININQINAYAGTGVINGMFAVVKYSGDVDLINPDTGEVEETLKCGSDTVSVCGLGEEYVIVKSSSIELYDSSHNKIGEVSDSRWSIWADNTSIYEQDGRYFGILGDMFRGKYYEFDFLNSVATEFLNPDDLTIDTRYISGPYILGVNAEYYIDPVNKNLVTLTDWNSTDLMPEAGLADTKFFGIDNERFVEAYNYNDGSVQVVMYEYDPTAGNSNRTPIVVGGFGCMNDIALRWGVYKFNTSQNEYRAVIEDYSENFSPTNDEESTSKRAALIQYFNEGNTPDIFYGDQFDYAYMYRNGMTQDMFPYMTGDIEEKFSELMPAMYNLMVNDGVCYRVFSGFCLIGNVGSYEIFGDNTEVSIDDRLALEEETGLTAFENFGWSSSIVYELLAEAISEGEIDRDYVLKALEIGYEYGRGPDEYMSDIYSPSFNTELALTNAVFDPMTYADDEREIGAFTLIGTPTLTGSFHPIDAIGLMAMSSSTEYPEACMELISHLFDEDVQMNGLMNSRMPVVNEYFENMCTYAMDHEAIPEEDHRLRGFYDYCDECSSDSIERFKNAVACSDFIHTYDMAVVDIVYEEVDSYYNDGKTAEEIADTLTSRLNLYYTENYG